MKSFRQKIEEKRVRLKEQRLLDFIMQLEKKIDKEILSDGKLSD